MGLSKDGNLSKSWETESLPKDIAQFIFMRTDLASLNPGKAMAQAAHAGDVLRHKVRDELVLEDKYQMWRDANDGVFGTCLVYGITEKQYRTIFTPSFQENFLAGPYVVHDPTYPLIDGDICHQIPLDTCWVALGFRGKVGRLLHLNDISLHA